MKLLAIDLGKFKSVACLYCGEEQTAFRTVETRPQAVHDLLVEMAPERLVIEVGTVSGWVYDLAVALGIEVQVANPNTEGWRWQRVKRKTDRDDALKLGAAVGFGAVAHGVDADAGGAAVAIADPLPARVGQSPHRNPQQHLIGVGYARASDGVGRPGLDGSGHRAVARGCASSLR